MDARTGAAASVTSYDDFEPLCNWRREEGSDTLIVHLPEFKKEQLKVQINNLGTLKLSGERPVSDTQRNRFYKEIRVPKDCDANEIHAKFMGGLLSIVMPKKGTLGSKNDQATKPQQPQLNEKAKSEINQNEAGNRPTVDGAARDQKIESSKTPTNYEFQQENLGSRMKSYKRVAMNVAVLVVVVCLIGGYVIHKYRSSVVEE